MKKFYTFMSIIVSVTLAVTVFAISAKDSVTTGVLFPSDINTDGLTALEILSSMNIADGFDDGQLHPEAPLTRAQFAKFLCNAFECVSIGSERHSFSDMEKTHWSYEYVHKAVGAGWLNGYPDNTFRPDENITFEQAVAVLCRVLDLDVYDNDYPVSYVSAAIDKSVTEGVSALIGEEINREQAARLIVNSMNHIADQAKEFVNRSFYSVTAPSAFLGSSGGGGGSANVSLSSAVMYDMEAIEDYRVIDDFYNSEEYTSEAENVFKNSLTSPLSTFSIDTDTASYSNMRRFILKGQKIPQGSVRSEELINYFDYASATVEEGTPFGINYTVAKCPWNTDHDLAMVTVSGEELTERKPSNLVFLIDVSGSMFDSNKLPLVKQALALLLEKLDENDRISIVTYASGTGVALEPTPATEKETILNVINNLQAGGSTAGASGINLAYEQAEKYKTDGNNRIILCTDGDFNVGISSSGDLEKLITEKRESGIFLSVLGFGMGNYKDSKMEILADKGNGNYAYIDNLREAKKVLVDEMPKTIYTIAKDVKIQTEFNPDLVEAYRLIGYENRLLNNEDFDNDKKDAGELGSGATVTVLYEIIPRKGAVESNLKYQKTQTTGSDELMNVKIRYKLPEREESILSEYPVKYEIAEDTGADFKFASAVAELGMILNESEYKGSATYETVKQLAREGIGEDKFGLRHEFVQLVDLLSYSCKNISY